MYVFLQTVIDLLATIPSLIWGVLVGLLPSALSNRWTNERFKKQLDHDLATKSMERLQSLRRQVYLEAMDAIATGIAAVAKFADLSASAMDITKEWNAKQPSLAKVHVVAGSDAFKSYLDIETCIGSAIGRLATRRLELEIKKTVLENLKERISRLDEDLRNLGNSIRDAESTIGTQFSLIPRMHADREKIRSDYELALSGRLNLEKELLAMTIDFGILSILEVSSLRSVVVPLVIEIRKELDLDVHEAAMAGFVEEANTERRKAHASVIEELQKFTKKMQME